MQLTGIIKFVGQLEGGVSKSGNQWQKQGFVVSTNEQYPKDVYFTLFGQERIAAAQLRVNDVVTVDFDITAREYNGRWYNDVSAWKVTKPQQEVPQQQSYSQPQQAPFPSGGARGASFGSSAGRQQQAAGQAQGQEDELPF